MQVITQNQCGFLVLLKISYTTLIDVQCLIEQCHHLIFNRFSLTIDPDNMRNYYFINLMVVFIELNDYVAGER